MTVKISLPGQFHQTNSESDNIIAEVSSRINDINKADTFFL